ncbi:MAG TPA: SRPBCC family protein [Thermoleophilaceae bacterium]|nr:SRPBCC family protein [Thermoleophilaceae bacterium]
MRPFTVHTSISAPREEVFDVVGDLAQRVGWCDHYMRDFRLARARSTGVGAAARFELDAPLASTWCEVTIEVYDRPRRIVERCRLWRRGRTPAAAVYELLRDVHGSTRVELTVWSEPATRIDALKESLGGRRWLRRQTKRALERLRSAVEGEREEPLPRARIAGYEPLKAPRFGSQI